MNSQDENRRATDVAIGSLTTAVDNVKDTVTSLAKIISDGNEATNEYRAEIRESNALRDRDVSELSKKVAGHDEIAKHISVEHLPEFNETMQHARGLKDRSKFYQELRDKLLGEAVIKGVMVALALLVAALLYAVAPELAKKLAAWI